MINELLLSFAIPTWNRNRELKECLDSIVSQIIEVDNSVEIFISDNASEDETSSILAEYSEKYPFIRYSRNENNLGFDLNLINAIEKSKGRYVWMFGDDDILACGALKKILSIIDEYNPDYISVNFYQWIQNGDSKEIVTNEILQMVNTDISNVNFNQFLMIRNCGVSGFLSSSIVKKAVINLQEVKSDIAKIILFPHLEIIAQAMSNNKGFVTSYYCVGQRKNNGREVSTILFLTSFPAAFKFVFDKFGVESKTREYIYSGIREMFLSPLLYQKTKILEGKNEIDLNPIPFPFQYLSMLVQDRNLISNAIIERDIIISKANRYFELISEQIKRKDSEIKNLKEDIEEYKQIIKNLDEAIKYKTDLEL